MRAGAGRGRQTQRSTNKVRAVATSPDRNDLEVLLRILEIFVSDPVRKARNFWRTIPDGLTLSELDEKYPRGSEAYEYIDTVLAFWETVGSLLKHRLLSEELAFDTFLDAPPWKRIETAALSLREERGALELENLEYAYRRSLEWLASKLTNQRRGS